MTQKHCLVHETQPPNFTPKVEVAACYCEFKGELLILKRHPHRPQGGLWGLPAGKLENGEAPSEGVLRELFEETGLLLAPKEIQFLGKLYVQHPDLDFIFHIFYKHFDLLPDVTLGLDEHVEARWVSYEDALKLPLINGGDQILFFIMRKIEEKQTL